MRSGKAALAWGNEYAEGFEEDVIKGFAKAGLKIDKPDLAPFQNAVKTVHKKFADDVGGIGLINRILDMQK